MHINSVWNSISYSLEKQRLKRQKTPNTSKNTEQRQLLHLNGDSGATILANCMADSYKVEIHLQLPGT